MCFALSLSLRFSRKEGGGLGEGTSGSYPCGSLPQSWILIFVFNKHRARRGPYNQPPPNALNKLMALVSRSSLVEI
jgi:hypothetical protein